MAMELVKASDLSAVVHKAIENLHELGKNAVFLSQALSIKSLICYSIHFEDIVNL